MEQQLAADRLRLEEMSEDEYDSLPDNEKERVDSKRLQIKKERLRKSALCLPLSAMSAITL